jgi:hypothetical protein
MGQSAAVPVLAVAAAIPSNTNVVNSTNANARANARANAKPSRAPTTIGKAPPPKKRKRSGHGWTRKKSHRPPKPPAHPDNYNFDRRRYYKIHGIIAETKGRYKIEWARLDSQGGQFIDTWVPKRYANQPAVADWEERQRERRTDKFNHEPGEYDSEGEMSASSITEDERQGKAKRGKKPCGGKANWKGKK